MVSKRPARAAANAAPPHPATPPHGLPPKAVKLVQKGARLVEKGDPNGGIRAYLQALDMSESGSEASGVIMQLMGNALQKAGHLYLALETLEEALKSRPADPDIFSCLGEIAMRLEMFDAAIQFYTVVTQLAPLHPVGYNNLASAQMRAEKYDEAIATLQTAIPMMETNPLLWTTLATVVAQRDGAEASLPFFGEAERLDPDFPRLHVNLGQTLIRYGRPRDGLPHAEKAARLMPNEAQVRNNLALALLATGELERGWREYIWRHRRITKEGLVFSHGLPTWEGGDIGDKTILVCAEQGIGDELLFATCLPDLMARAGHCVIQCDNRLIDLYKRSFPAASVHKYVSYFDNGRHHRASDPDASYPTPDLAIPLGDLGGFLRPDLDSFPAAPCLVPSGDEVAAWKDRLAKAAGGRLTVGISWRGGLVDAIRSWNYSRIEDWAPILKTPGVAFVNLQYGDFRDELDFVSREFGVEVIEFPELDMKNDIDRIAALCGALDIVASVGTTVSQLAADVGAECWVLSRPGTWPCHGTDRDFWKPGSRLFFADSEGGWERPVAELAAALKERAGSR